MISPMALPRQAPIAIVGKKIPAGIYNVSVRNKEVSDEMAYHHAETPRCEKHLDKSGENQQEYVTPQRCRTWKGMSNHIPSGM